MARGIRGRGHVWQGGHAWWGACVVGDICGGGHAWHGGVRSRYYEIRSMSGR